VVKPGDAVAQARSGRICSTTTDAGAGSSQAG